MHRTLADVVRVVSSLPPERVEEVYDFALFLKTRLQGPIDEDDDQPGRDWDEIKARLRIALST